MIPTTDKPAKRPLLRSAELYTFILLVVIIGACICIYQRQNANFKKMQEHHASAAREQLIAEITRDTGLKKIAAEPDKLRDLILQRDMHEAAEQHTNAAMEQYRNELNNAQSWLEVFLGLLGIITVVFGLIGYWNARETRKDLQEAQEAMTMALQMKSEIAQAHAEVTAQQESAKKIAADMGLLQASADPSEPLSEHLKSKVEEIVKASAPLIEQLKALYYAKGQEAYDPAWDSQKEDDWKRALRFFGYYLDYDMANESIWFMKANCHHFLNDNDNAILCNTEALRLKPDFSQAYNNRGNAYLTKGDSDLAIADYNDAIRLKPDDAQARNNRGSAHYNKGDYDYAIADYTEALRLEPDYALAFTNRGNSYLDKGDYVLAMADQNEAIRLKPDYAEAHNNRGKTYAFNGEYELAIADFTKSIELNNPKLWFPYSNRGLTQELKADNNQGDPRTHLLQAIADYEKALSHKPDFEKAKTNLAIAQQKLKDLPNP